MIPTACQQAARHTTPSTPFHTSALFPHSDAKPATPRPLSQSAASEVTDHERRLAAVAVATPATVAVAALS